jgi:hypothetical protein
VDDEVERIGTPARTSGSGGVRRRKIELGPIGPDVDLDTEEIYAADGRRLTYELAAEIAERALERHRGRLTGGDSERRTPRLTLRVPPEVRAALESIADAQGRRLADVSRDALAEYVDRHTSPPRDVTP